MHVRTSLFGFAVAISCLAGCNSSRSLPIAVYDAPSHTLVLSDSMISISTGGESFDIADGFDLRGSSAEYLFVSGDTTFYYFVDSRNTTEMCSYYGFVHDEALTQVGECDKRFNPLWSGLITPNSPRSKTFYFAPSHGEYRLDSIYTLDISTGLIEPTGIRGRDPSFSGEWLSYASMAVEDRGSLVTIRASDRDTLNYVRSLNPTNISSGLHSSGLVVVARHDSAPGTEDNALTLVLVCGTDDCESYSVDSGSRDQFVGVYHSLDKINLVFEDNIKYKRKVLVPGQNQYEYLDYDESKRYVRFDTYKGEVVWIKLP